MIRSVQTKDLAAIAEIEKISQSSPWSREAFQSLFSQKHVGAFLIEVEHSILAYCFFSTIQSECEILNIVVHPLHRKKHLATQLLAHLFDLEGYANHEYFLEVRSSNQAAIALYRKYGFVQIGRRLGYYSDNQEDALLMKMAKPY